MKQLASMPILLLGMLCSPVATQAVDLDTVHERVNGGTVGVMGGSIGGTYAQLIQDLSYVLADGYDMRVVPMIASEGSVRRTEDLLYLKGVDVAVVQSDVLDFYRKEQLYPDIEQHIRYIAPLFNEEIHIVAKRGIGSIYDLSNRQVSFGPRGSGSFMTASNIFDNLGIQVQVVNLPFEVGLDKLRQGDIDAWIRVAGKPVSQLEDIKWEDGLHLLAIPGDRIQGAYHAASFTARDYPQFIAPANQVQSLAVTAVMAAYNFAADHPRRRKIERFVRRFREKFPELLQSEYHPKWQETDLEAEVPGWQRFSLITDER